MGTKKNEAIPTLFRCGRGKKWFRYDTPRAHTRKKPQRSGLFAKKEKQGSVTLAHAPVEITITGFCAFALVKCKSRLRRECLKLHQLCKISWSKVCLAENAVRLTLWRDDNRRAKAFSIQGAWSFTSDSQMLLMDGATLYCLKGILGGKRQKKLTYGSVFCVFHKGGLLPDRMPPATEKQCYTSVCPIWMGFIN